MAYTDPRKTKSGNDELAYVVALVILLVGLIAGAIALGTGRTNRGAIMLVVALLGAALWGLVVAAYRAL